MIDRKVGALLCALWIASATACGDDGGDGDGGLEDGGNAGASGASGEGGEGGDSGAGAGGTGGTSGTGGGGGCLDPLEQDMVFEPMNLSEGSVIYKVVEDDGTLFFSTVDRVFRVSADGGTPEEIYFKDLAIVVKFWVREDDVMILEGGDTLVSIPKEGGEPTELATLPFTVQSALDGSIEMIVEGDVAYAKSEEGGFGEPAVSTFHEIDLGTYETREIGTAGEIDGGFTKIGDALYFAIDDPSVEPDPDSFGEFIPDLMWRLPIAGGELEEVPLEGPALRLGVIGTDGESIYALGSADPNDMMLSGVFRIATDGGAPELAHDQFVFAALTFAIHNTPSRTLLRDLDTFYELPTTGTATELFCVGGGGFTTHGSTATDEAAFVTPFHSADEDTFIVRMPLD